MSWPAEPAIFFVEAVTPLCDPAGMQRQLQLPLGELSTASRDAGWQRDARSTSRSGRVLRNSAYRSAGDHCGELASRSRHTEPENWRIDQHTRATGRQGLACARAALAGLGSGKAGLGPAARAA